MADINQILKSLLSDPGMPVDPKWIDEMAAAYPAFYFPTALFVKRSHTDLDKADLDTLLTSLAVQCPDRVAIADFTDTADAGWSDFYPNFSKPQESSTDTTIDTFINTYGHSSPQEDALLERLIFSPVPADYLGADDDSFDPSAPLSLPPELSGQPDEAPPHAVITSEPAIAPPPFVGLKQSQAAPPPFTGLKQEEDQTPPPPPSASSPEAVVTEESPQSPPPAPDTSLMESLAKFFIKKGRYERAYDIISDLSLKFPEKSVYFAEQLRFLQKKMLSQKLSQENKTKNQE